MCMCECVYMFVGGMMEAIEAGDVCKCWWCRNNMGGGIWVFKSYERTILIL